MKSKLLLACLLVTQISYGQGMFSKIIAKTAKMVSSFTTSSTSTLEGLTPTVGIGSNLHPAKLGSMDQTFFSNWKDGGDAVSIGFNTGGTSFLKIDGTVTIDGKPAEYMLAGTYGLVLDPSTAPRKVEVITKTGQRTSFMIAPYIKPIKVISINGQKDNVALDLSKDVVIEMETAPGFENALLTVKIAITQISLKSQFEVCYIRNGISKITIPAAAFRNINIKPDAEFLYNYKGSYLSVIVEGTDKATAVEGVFPEVKYTKMYEDGKMCTITTEPKLNTGLIANETDKKVDMKYDFYKPNAFRSHPTEHLKKLGVKSFAIRGTTYHESSSTSTSSNTLNMGGISNTTTTTTTTTIKLEFPQQPDAVWDALLERLYPDLIAVVESELGTTVLPLEKITNTETYKKYETFASDDKNTKVEFSRAFRNTKVMSAFMPLGDGYGVNGNNEKIMNESGADGLLSMTIDLEISSSKDGKVLMIPKFAFNIEGKTNGKTVNTKYITGTIQSITGVSFKTNITGEELDKIIRKSDLLATFRKGLKEIRDKENANGDYPIVWNLQK